MIGAIAEAYYKDVPNEILYEVKKRIPIDFQKVIDKFRNKYNAQT